jgi:hypothetical protein
MSITFLLPFTIAIQPEYLELPFRHIDIWGKIDLALPIPGSLKRVTFVTFASSSWESLGRVLIDTLPKFWSTANAQSRNAGGSSE